jgi:peptide chain release factor subunit 1
MEREVDMNIEPKDLQRLRGLRNVSTDAGILSVYLPIDPGTSPHRGYVPALMDLLKPLRDEGQAQHDRIEAEAERVLAHVRESSPEGTAVVMFSSEPAGIWETFSLQLPVTAKARWGRRPHLLPLQAWLDDFPTAVLALADQRDARIYLLQLGDMEQERRVIGHTPGRQRQGGWSAFRYERDRQRHVQEHLHDVAQELAEVALQEGAEYVVLAGTDETTSLLAKQLPSSVASKLAGTFRAEMFATDAAIAESAGEVIDAAEREQERALAQEVVDAAMAGGRASLGAEETLQMLREGRAHQLVISAQALQTPPGDSAATIAEDAGLAIEVVHDAGADVLAPHGGIGAVLRY